MRKRILISDAPVIGINASGFLPVGRYAVPVLAVSAGERAAGILLTGMGEDGAKGLQEMRSAGAYTVAQDRESSEIYGMPKAAVALGGVCRQLPLSEIPAAVMEFAGRWRHG